MNIAILSRGPGLYSTQSLLIAGQRRGHRMYLIDYMDCTLVMEGNEPQVYYKEERLGRIDAIIPRIGASGTFYGASVVKQFEMQKVFTTLPSEALLCSRNKLRSMQALSESPNINFPRTTFGHFNQNVDFLLESVGGVPVVIKLLRGTHGLGVVLAKDQTTAESIIESFNKLKERVIVQEFIKEASGEDIRALVVGEEIVAAMKRKARPGEFRSNLHRGGTSIHIKLTNAERRAALDAVRLLGLKVAGVDMLQSSRGPLILEVNPSPGLEGIETTTNVDVAGKIIELIEKNAG